MSAVVAVVMVKNNSAAQAAPDWEGILADEQWKEVVQLSGLPPQARPEIGTAIATYRSWQAKIDNRKAPAEIRDEMKRLRTEAQALLKDLARAMSHADTHFALTCPFPPPQGWPPHTVPVPQEVAHQQLNFMLHELERLIQRLDLARLQVRSGKTGQKRLATPAYFLVNHLNQILERFTGKTITRSTKRPEIMEFVKIVCRIADPDIGDGTIAEAMKKEIKYYKPSGGISPDPAGIIPPPIVGSPSPIQRDNRPRVRKSTKRT